MLPVVIMKFGAYLMSILVRVKVGALMMPRLTMRAKLVRDPISFS
jgi:hypothetical protein